MFLANNPNYNTAKDIVDLRGLKANLISVNVEKLVQDGYLERKSFPGNRRKTILICTTKAQPIIGKGRQLPAVFANKAEPRTLNRATGIVLVVLGAVIMLFTFFK